MKVLSTYTKLAEIFYDINQPTSFKSAQKIVFNHDLLKSLEIEIDEDELLKIFSGQDSFPHAKCLSLAYSGHQFGHFNPTLGDGRAHLIAEVLTSNKEHFDIQLKGSGQTKYSRRGDGLSSLGPVLREYIVSEAMHAMGVPSTRALCALKTNQSVYREEELPGGVFTRVAKSHLRVGSFEFLFSRQEFDALEELVNYTMKRHYPHIESVLDFFKAVALNKLNLVSQWMGLGFIHGVMNTDNTSVAGITIDYGPCAFMDEYKSDQVFSSIDHQGRYRYNNQFDIALWNLSVFANAIFPVLLKERNEAELIGELKSFFKELEQTIKDKWLHTFAYKIGIEKPLESDRALINKLLEIMEKEKLDFTNTFRNLNQFTFQDKSWQALWLKRIEDKAKAKTLMDQHNPFIIPRNHQVEKAIKDGLEDNFEHFFRLIKAYADPYTYKQENIDLTKEPGREQRVYQTFCGT